MPLIICDTSGAIQFAWAIQDFLMLAQYILYDKKNPTLYKVYIIYIRKDINSIWAILGY